MFCTCFLPGDTMLPGSPARGHTFAPTRSLGSDAGLSSSRFETSHIEWSKIEYYISSYKRALLDDPEIIVTKTWDTEFFHASRGTPMENNRLTIYKGDAEGVRLRSADGRSIAAGAHPKEALCSLVTDDGQCLACLQRVTAG